MPVVSSEEAAPPPMEAQPPLLKSAVTNTSAMPSFGGASSSFTADAVMVAGRAPTAILPQPVQLEAAPMPMAPLHLQPHNLTNSVSAPSALPMPMHAYPAHGVGAPAPPLQFQQQQHQLLQQQHAAQMHVAQLQQQQLHTRSMMMQQMAIHQQQQQQHIFQQQQQVAAMQHHRQQQQQQQQQQMQQQLQSAGLMAPAAASPLMQQPYQVQGNLFPHAPAAPIMAQGPYLPAGVAYPHMHTMPAPVHFGGPPGSALQQPMQGVQPAGVMEPPLNGAAVAVGGGVLHMDPMFALHQQQLRIQQQQQQQQQMNAAFHHQQQQQAALQHQQQLQQQQQQHLQMSQPHPAPYAPSVHSTPSSASVTVALPSSASSASLSGMTSGAASTSNSPAHTPPVGGPLQLAIKVPSPSLMLSPPLHAQSVHTINTPVSRSPTAVSASATPLRLVGGATLALPASASGGRHSAISPHKPVGVGVGVLASMVAPGSRPHLLTRPVLAKAIPPPVASSHNAKGSPPASALHTLSLLSRGSTGSASGGDVTPAVAVPVVAVPVVPRRSHHKRKSVPDEELLRRRRLRELDAQEEVARELRVARMDGVGAAAAPDEHEHENMDVLSALVAVASSSAMQSTSTGASSSSSSHHREPKRARHSHHGSGASGGTTRLAGVSATAPPRGRPSATSRRDESVGSDSDAEEENEFEGAGRAEEDEAEDDAAAAEEDEEGTDDDEDDEEGGSGSSSGPQSPATPRSSGGGGGGRSRYCLPCPLISHLPKVPLQTLYLQVQKQYTVSKKEMEARKYTAAEREELVSVPVRIMGSASEVGAGAGAGAGSGLGRVYFVAKDVCLLVFIRKGNVAKSIGQFLAHEKARLPVLCPRSNGTSSTHVLTALSVEGLKRLLRSSKSPLAMHVLKFLMGHVKAMAASLAKNAAAGGALAAPGRRLNATVTERINMGGESGGASQRKSSGAANRKTVRPAPAPAAAAAVESDDEGSDAHSGSVESHSDEDEAEEEEEGEDAGAVATPSSPSVVSSSRRSSVSATAATAASAAATTATGAAAAPSHPKVVRAIARDVSSTARPKALAVITSDSFIIAPRGGKAPTKGSS